MQIYEEKPKQDIIITNPLEAQVKKGLNLALFLGGWIGLTILATIVMFILDAFGLEGDNLSQWGNFLVYALLTLGFILILIFYNKQQLIKDFLKEFKNKKAYSYGLLGMAMIYGGNIVCSIVLSIMFPGFGDNANEQAVNSMLLNYPVTSFFWVVLFAPFCEEMTYRFGLFGLVRRKNVKLAFVITILVFAFIHCDTSGILLAVGGGNYTYILNELLNMPIYMVGAFALTFVYYKSNSIVASLTTHVLNNLMSYVVTIALLGII